MNLGTSAGAAQARQEGVAVVRRTCWGGVKAQAEITSGGTCTFRRDGRVVEKGPLVRGEGYSARAKRRGAIGGKWRIVEVGTGGISWQQEFLQLCFLRRLVLRKTAIV